MLFLLNGSYKAVWGNLYGLESLADPLVTNENKPIKDQNLSDVKGKHKTFILFQKKVFFIHLCPYI